MQFMGNSQFQKAPPAGNVDNFDDFLAGKVKIDRLARPQPCSRQLQRSQADNAAHQFDDEAVYRGLCAQKLGADLVDIIQRRQLELMALAQFFETRHLDTAHRPLHRRVIAIAPCLGPRRRYCDALHRLPST